MGSTGHEGNTTPTSSPTTATAATAPPRSPLPIIELLDWHLDRVPDDFEVNESTENVNRVLAAVRDGLRPKTHAELASERNPLPNPQQPVEGPRTDARVPKSKAHDLYTSKPLPVNDDEMEDVGFQAAGDGPEHPIALKSNEIIANLNSSSDKLYQAMTEQRDRFSQEMTQERDRPSQWTKEQRDGLSQEMTQERDKLSQWTKEQRDGLSQKMTELEDEKNKWWSEGSKRKRLAEELYDRREGLATKDHESRQDEFRLKFDTRLEDATRQIREVALEERKLQQQDFDAKVQQMQKDFDDKAEQAQKDSDEMAKRAQIAADSHTTQQVERVIREIQLEALRTQQAQNTEYDRRRKQQARRKLNALDAEDALRINFYEAQRKALEEELAE
jgi:hypothetical protein